MGELPSAANRRAGRPPGNRALLISSPAPWWAVAGLVWGWGRETSDRNPVKDLSGADYELIPGCEPGSHALGELGPPTPTLTQSLLLMRERGPFGTGASGVL